MNLKILFWFYKDFDVCKNKLEILRKYNKNIKIYGLYGGPEEHIKKFKKLKLDEFYICPHNNKFYKWINGDLILLDWFLNAGKKLKWDSIVIIQEDFLVLDSIKKIFKNIKKNQIFLPHYELITPKIEKQWSWTSLKEDKNTSKKSKYKKYMRRMYLDFKKYVKEQYKYNEKIPRTIFYFSIIPRKFFEKYSKIENKELGFLEYKIPTYAKIFKIPIFKLNIGEKEYIKKPTYYPLNAHNKEIPLNYIKRELNDKKGYRLFHPVWKIHEF